jgi:hypothetical protein
LHSLHLKTPKGEEAIEEDPFLILGYGINSYFDILLNLFWMFTFITIFCIPIYIIFAQNRYFAEWKTYQISRFSLGNMGGASMACF